MIPANAIVSGVAGFAIEHYQLKNRLLLIDGEIEELQTKLDAIDDPSLPHIPPAVQDEYMDIEDAIYELEQEREYIEGELHIMEGRSLDTCDM